MTMQTDAGTKAYLRYVSGDDSAMTDLLQSYWDGLLWYLNSITGNLHTAEEAAEEVFVKLAVQKPKFRGDSSFRTWLYAIGRNAARDLLRKDRYAHSHHGATKTEESETAETEFFREEGNLQLHHAMEQLHPDYRQVLHLRYFVQFDTAEICKVTHKTKKQVENLLYRAKDALRKQLEKEGFVYEEL